MTSALPEPASELTTRLVAQAMSVPERLFDVPAEKTQSSYGISPELLEHLVGAGLPFETRDGDRVFAAADLHYIALRLGLVGPALLLSRLQARTLLDAEANPLLPFSITALAQGNPRAGALATPAASGMLMPEGAAPAPEAGNRRGLWSVIVTPPSYSQKADLGLRGVLETVGLLDWYQLPLRYETDVAFAKATQLHSCITATQAVHQAVTAAGYHGRRVMGLLLGVPYSTPHVWTEVRLDGVWTPIDPFLLGSLTRFGGLPAADWPIERSPGRILVRFATQPSRLGRAQVTLQLRDDPEQVVLPGDPRALVFVTRLAPVL